MNIQGSVDNESKAEANLMDVIDVLTDLFILRGRRRSTPGKWPGVRGGGCTEMDRNGRRQGVSHQTGIAIGERR